MDPKTFLAAVIRARDTLPYGQRPTDTHVRVAAKLAHWRTATPTHRALARAAKCDRSTVLRAVARLRALGLLTWQPRTVCGRGFAVRIANLYALGRGQSLEKPIRIQCSGTLQHPPAAPALAAVREARETRLMARWAARPTVRPG